MPLPSPIPSIENLRCFDAAARLLRFRAAAKAVALTPAALGHRIRQLEDELGVKLFERTTRTVRLTAEGHAVLPHARAALDAAAACARAARGEIGPTPVDILVGTRHELGISWLTPSISKIERAVPGLGLHLYFGSGPDLMMRVRTLEVDCAVTSSRLADPTLDSIPLHEEHYAFVASPKLLRGLPLRRSEDARAHTLIDASPELPLFGYWRDAAGGGDRLSFGKVVRIGTIGAIRELVLAQHGVAVLPLYIVRDDLRARRLVRVFPRVTPIHDWFRLIYRRDDPRVSIYQSLANALIAMPLR